MMWSFSGHRTFRKCQRQWYYKHVFGNMRAKNPMRKEAARLGKLQSVQAWRGKIVDTIISNDVIPSITYKNPITQESATERAKVIFTEERKQFTVNSSTVRGSFMDVEYGNAIPEEAFDKAWQDIENAIKNFYEHKDLWNILTKSKRLVAQRPISFKHGDVSVRVVPDLIAFQHHDPPTIFDWKVHSYPMRDYWLQFVTGALAVTRCNPHKDWPQVNHVPESTRLVEVQLLTGDLRTHPITTTTLQDAENFITISSNEMLLAIPEDAIPQDFPTATDPSACQYCPFKKICWRQP